MRRLRSMTREEVMVAIAVIALATIACLSPVHNDTWWHLAYGREMALAGGFAQSDRFSFTAFAQPFTNHQWLGERLFFAVWSVGGMPLLTAFCAALIVGGWSLSWHLSRGQTVDRLLVVGAAAAGSTLVWSIRPQVFSVALLPVVVLLLGRDRLGWIPLVILIWANLHGGVMLGLIAIAAWAATATIYDRRRLARLTQTLVLSALATVVTPLGWRYWPEILASLQRSQSNRLQEWQPPGLPPDQIVFWAAAAAVVVLAIRHWSRLTSTDDRALVGTSLLLLASATRALRNVAPFLMLAGPSLTRLIWPPSPRRHHGMPWPLGTVAVAGCAVAAIVVVANAWSRPWRMLQWSPMSAADASAVAACPAPIYNTYAAGGPIIWFVPGQKVFVDSRQDPYPPGLIEQATAVENGADPRPLLRRFDIRCAVLPPTSPTVATLEAGGWRLRYRSSGWVVLERP